MKQANFGLAMKSLVTSDNGITGWSEEYDDGWAFPFGGNADFYHFAANNMESYARAYFDCPPLSALINRKAQTFTNGESYIINTSGKDKDRESQTTVAKKIRKLMDNPNPLQTREEFENQIYIYTQLFGYAVVLFDKPYGFKNYDADKMWVLPPHILEIKEKKGIFYKGKNAQFESIRITYGGEYTDLPSDGVAVIRDIMPSFTSVMLPDSRVKTLQMPINNIIGAYESRNMLINSRGALGMLTNQTKDGFSPIPLGVEEKKKLHRDFKRLYGLRKGQSHIIISSANLKWQPMVLPTKDLMLFEEIEDDGNRLCDAYMFPSEIFAKMNGGTTYSNIATATRNLYQDAIIPESKNIYSQWNKIFDTASHSLEMGREYKNLPALQGANKEEAEAMLRLNQAMQIAFLKDVVMQNEWRIKLGFDPKPDGNVWYSDVKDKLSVNYNNGQDQAQLDSMYVNDGTNAGNNSTALPVKD